MNIVDVIFEENVGRGQRRAVIEERRAVTYEELFKAVERTACTLSEQGIRKYDRVALYYGDGINYIILSLAVLKLDAVMVPVSPSYSFDDLERAMRSIDTAWLISEVIIEGYDCGEVLCSDVGTLFLHSRLAENKLPPEFCECGPAFIRFSSGTTGVSKGVLISHKAIVERTDSADRGMSVTENDTILWLLSMSFHFVVTILLFLRRGACILLCGNNFPSDLLTSLSSAEGTFIYASPFHYKLMSESKDLDPEDFSGIRMAISTAMSLSDDIAESFKMRFELELSQAYGIIEVGLPFIEKVAEGHMNGAVGMIGSDYKIKLTDEGEILLRGKGMFTAYIAPWQTLRDIDPDGWFHTGDIGRIDEAGRLFIEGRKKEVINFAGMKIFPREVETVLNQHDTIEDSQVYGVPDATYGQLPAARVQLSQGAFDEKTIRRFCYGLLPSYKVPKYFEVTDRILKTHSGKTIRQ